MTDLTLQKRSPRFETDPETGINAAFVDPKQIKDQPVIEQDREKSEARRLQDQKLRKAREQAADEEAKRRLGELFLEVQRREDEVKELDVEQPSNGYRPDERELFRDRADDLDWERANREYEER